MMFQAKSSIWTPHCGIVSLNSDFILTSPPTLLGPDGRYILTSLKSNSNAALPIAHVLGIYAPADRASRGPFFAALAANSTITTTLQQLEIPVFILGDFNYNISSTLPTNYDLWLQLLQGYFTDCFRDNPLPTFLSTRGTRQRLDYIYCSSHYHPQVHQAHLEPLPYDWTDHSLLSITCTLKSNDRGPGNWKANPFLAKVPAYRRGLHEHIQQLFDKYQPTLDLSPSAPAYSAQLVWDELKGEVALFSKHFQLDRTSWLKKVTKQLLSKRNRILRDYKNTAILSTLLPSIEALLHQLQEEFAQIEILKAGKLWREKGERSSGLFKRMVATLDAQRETPALYNRQGTLTTTHEEKIEVIHQFYSDLYSPTPPDDNAINQLLGVDVNRDNHLHISDDDQEALVAPFDLDDIIEASKRHPKQSSPGSDHLPYEILGFLVRHPAAKELVLHIYNQALSHAIFPPSWDKSIMTLLPKKGDLADIGNHRPLQLVNCDSKIFTRLLNSRIMTVAENIINPHQQGFMPGRFIGTNGLLAQMVLEDAAAYHANAFGLGLLLDQQKAYDRVNLDYLKTVLLHYGFPMMLVHALYSLFRNNHIVLNVNGHLSSNTVPKLRGLKQGDPISCILYNFALEPLLRSILADDRVQGYSFHRRYPAQSPPTPPIKLLSYADDTLLLLRDVNDLHHVANHLHNYSQASNAQINFHKTRAISLSGHAIDDHWMPALQQFDIRHIWTTEDEEAITYLGYPLVQCRRQRDAFTNHFLGQLRHTADLHTRRSISVYGRATIANSLLLSRCWYVLSVLPLTLDFLKKIRTIITSFVTYRISPVISWDLMVTPKSSGGLGIIDLFAQQKALYYRWLDPVLFARPDAPAITNYVRVHLHNQMNTSTLDMGLLFPAARSVALVGAPATTTTMIFRAMDAIPRTFSPIDRNPIECLLLPFPAIIASASHGYKLSPRLKTVTVGDIFELQGPGFFLTAIPGNRLPSDIRVVTHRFHFAVIRDRFIFQPFFRACLDPTPLNLFSQDDRPHIQALLNFASFRRGLHIQPNDPNFTYPQGRTRSFRQMVLKATERTLPSLPNIAASSWNAFWALFLNHTHRNVLYRLLQDKIPTRLSRSRYNYTFEPHCAICLTMVESTDHFFFYCEVKQHFWDRLIQEYLWPGTSVNIVKDSILTLNFDHIYARLDSPTNFEPLVIFIVALAEVWKAHWRFIFDNAPLTTDTLFASFQRALRKQQAEDNLSPSVG